MKEKNLENILNDWLIQKKNIPEYSVEEYALKKYLEIHKEDYKTQQEKEEFFYKCAKAWKSNGQKFEKFAGKFSNSPILEQWQAAQMLDNVIKELDMELVEQYRYLLNVKMIIYYKLINLIDKQSGETVKKVFENEYEMDWAKAENGIDESDIQDIFAQTVSLMCYAGIAYNDETRMILANIGVGQDVEFNFNLSSDADKDIQFLTNFIVSEMISDNDYNEEDKNILVKEVVPVCTSSVSMIEKGSNPDCIIKLMQSYLGKIIKKKNLIILAELVAIFAASKIVFLLIQLAIAGKVIEIGLRVLWKHCKEAINNLDYNEYKFLQPFLLKKASINTKNYKQETMKTSSVEKFNKSINEMESENA